MKSLIHESSIVTKKELMELLQMQEEMRQEYPVSELIEELLVNAEKHNISSNLPRPVEIKSVA